LYNNTEYVAIFSHERPRIKHAGASEKYILRVNRQGHVSMGRHADGN